MIVLVALGPLTCAELSAVANTGAAAVAALIKIPEPVIGFICGIVYKNVLGRPEGAAPTGLEYWNNALLQGTETRGTLTSAIIQSAHSYKGNMTWGWVADLLDNKIEVAKNFSITHGLSYNNPDTAITQGMAIASAITANNTDNAIALIGVDLSNVLIN